MPAPPVQYVKTRDGFDIACFVAGSGKTIIRVPNMWNHAGRQWSGHILEPVFDAFARRFRLVLYDSRGQGLSTRNLPETLNISDYVTDLEAVIDRFAPQRFVLDGWSFMGVIALQYAVEHPERVEAVVLHDYLDMHVRTATPAMGEIAVVDWPLYIESSARMGWIQFDPEVIKRMLNEAMSQADHLLQRRAIAAVSGEELMSRVEVPVLFLAARGGSRPLSSEEATKRWAATLPKARLAFFEEPGGPFSLAAVETVERFLDELDEGNEDHLLDEDAMAALSAARRARLSRRETEVLLLIAAGKSNQQIADALVLSLRTVERHITNLYAKIGAHGKADATAYALRHGLA